MEGAALDLNIGPLQDGELDAADHIFRLAFGTRVGLPDPARFGGDAAMIRTRYRAGHVAARGARIKGELVGSSFATKWGSVGVFGPLSVRPDLWDQGIAKKLMESTIELFCQWDNNHVGLFTPSDSIKHVGLYQKFGFWPRFLTAIMSKPVTQPASKAQWSRYSELSEREQAQCTEACRDITFALYDGLDLTGEMRSVASQRLGDTILLWEDNKLVAFAICHWGPGTEAGSGVCFVKFGAVKPGPVAGEAFDRLLDTCEAVAAAQGMQRLITGVNTSRHDAYGRMLRRGFRTAVQGVAMHRPNESGYSRSDAYAVDDWR